MESTDDKPSPQMDFEAQLKQLDLQLLYLWRAHGIDYYAGIESFDPEKPELPPAGKHMQRCTRPEEGEQADDAEGESSPHLTSTSPQRPSMRRDSNQIVMSLRATCSCVARHVVGMSRQRCDVCMSVCTQGYRGILMRRIQV